MYLQQFNRLDLEFRPCFRFFRKFVYDVRKKETCVLDRVIISNAAYGYLLPFENLSFNWKIHR